ncbi:MULTISPECIES: hypothetical protein [Actinokineospora]|uniref:hypothetical protein n=1 Tax=Actinokineospora TaxID=39845 RepID=UPI00166FF82E|nr:MULTISPECIES: hypothetical protein [Actinokineospora]UVS76937.1 hypothetical protein Actkin_00634 [Actinokineospora sp. UTMC 2448]
MLILLALAVIALVLLDRNHQPGHRMAGSTDIDDRDRARVRAELAYARPVTRHQVSARRAATVRLATGPR